MFSLDKMFARSALVLFAGGCLAGCVASPPPSPAHLARKIALLPVNNRTGDPLVVAGVGPIDRYVLRSETITVADVLRSEAWSQLEANGFEVSRSPSVDATLKGRVPTDTASAGDMAAQLGVLCLYLEIRRWEADAPMHPKRVVVAFAADFIDPSNKQAVWHAERRPSPVPTAGLVMMEAAYVAAARKIVEDYFSALRPETPTPK